jgi:hypothetical protein
MMDTGKEVMQRHQSRVQHGIRKKRDVLMAVQCGAGHELGSSSISVRAVRVHGQAERQTVSLTVQFRPLLQ